VCFVLEEKHITVEVMTELLAEVVHTGVFSLVAGTINHQGDCVDFHLVESPGVYLADFVRKVDEIVNALIEREARKLSATAGGAVRGVLVKHKAVLVLLDELLHSSFKFREHRGAVDAGHRVLFDIGLKALSQFWKRKLVICI